MRRAPTLSHTTERQELAFGDIQLAARPNSASTSAPRRATGWTRQFHNADRWAIALVLLAVACGCEATKPPGATTTEQKPAESHSTDILESALYQLQPENLGIDADLNAAVALMNTWASLEPGNTTPAAPALDGFTEDAIRQLNLSDQRLTYDAPDGWHIRDVFLMEKVAGHATGSAGTDVDRVTELFKYVCRNVALIADSDTTFPFNPYYTTLLGRGTAADRAWIFATLLRQLRIDAVILVSGSDAVSSDAPWLVGVLLDRDVYLFDPAIGLPVPADSAFAKFATLAPATLKQVQAKPELLSSLSPRSDTPFRIDAEQLKSAKVLLISEGPFGAARMERLQKALPAAFVGIVYDPVVDVGEVSGVRSRVSKAYPEFTTDRIGVWSFPTARQAKLATMPEEVRATVALRSSNELRPFAAPFVLERGGKKQVSANDIVQERSANQTQNQDGAMRLVASQRQGKMRVFQLEGKRKEALAGFVTVRQAAIRQPPGPEFQKIHDLAAEDASYWAAICQYELGDDKVAIDSLKLYLKQHRRGRWVSPARQLLGLALFRTGQSADAKAVFESPLSDDPNRTANQILVKRYAAAAGANQPEQNNYEAKPPAADARPTDAQESPASPASGDAESPAETAEPAPPPAGENPPESN